MAKKPFKNKTDFDPGRLRFPLQFYRETVTESPSGGQTVSWVLALETRAGKMKISEGNQMALAAGATVFDQDTYFIVRYRRDFDIEKDLRIVCEDIRYTILGFTPLDVPVNYIKILAQRSDWGGDIDG